LKTVSPVRLLDVALLDRNRRRNRSGSAAEDSAVPEVELKSVNVSFVLKQIALVINLEMS